MQQHASAAFEQQRGLHVAYLLVTYMHACTQSIQQQVPLQ
jgi:hypothetical protein